MAVLLQKFGHFVAPSLMKMVRSSIRPEWDAFDLLERTETVIHMVVRAQNPEAAPPELECERVGPKQVRIVYRSDRKLCGIVPGIVRALGEHYNQKLSVTETTCMLRHDPCCRFSIRGI